MRKARFNYINKMITDGMADNNKPFWWYVKSQKKDSVGIASLKTENGTFTDDSNKQAEILNSQFQSVFTKDNSSNLPQMGEPEYPKINELKITVEGVEKLLRNLKVNKSPGPDDIPARILKELAHEIAPVLTHIFIQSLETGEIPEDWLKANIAPIYKK